MQRALFATVLIGLVALINSEQCTVNGDCRGTHCDAGNHVICEHPAHTGVIQNGGLCTCAQDDLSCTTKDDCLTSHPNINLPCSDDRRHCYDSKCICSRH